MSNTKCLRDMFIGATAWWHNLIVVTRPTVNSEGTAVPIFNPFEE